MSTDNKTIREQAIEWWMNLDIVSIHELAIQYDCTYCTDDDKIRIYLSEHPQQTVKEDSVLSLEDAFENWLKDKDGEYRRMYGHHFRSFKGGADFKEQQYSELLSSYESMRNSFYMDICRAYNAGKQSMNSASRCKKRR